MKRLDRKQRVTAVPYQKPGVPASVGLTAEACKKAAWAVTPEGHRYRGAEAVNLVLAVALGTRFPHALYRLPLMGAHKTAPTTGLPPTVTDFPGMSRTAHDTRESALEGSRRTCDGGK